MTFIYDILVNLNEEVIDFYDWNSNDEFTHIRKVPLFRANESVITDMLYRRVKVSEDFLNLIKDKTQMFSGRNIDNIPYAAIFCDTYKAIMVVFNSKGYVKERSKFLINEEFEVIDLTCSIKSSIINYNVINKNYKMVNMIRSDRSIVDNILRELDLIKDDKEKIEYLYYEWFDKKDSDNMYNDLVKDIKSVFTDKHKEFLDVINLLAVKK